MSSTTMGKAEDSLSPAGRNIREGMTTHREVTKVDGIIADRIFTDEVKTGGGIETKETRTETESGIMGTSKAIN